MLLDVGKADTHDMSDIEALDAHFAKRRDDELAANMAAEQAKIDVARSAARATAIKRAGVATLLGGVGLGAALFGASFLLKPKIVTVEKLTERIIEKPVDRVVEKIVTKEVPGPERIVEKIVEKPVYITKKEDDFIHRPDYEAAANKGRIIKSKDGIGVFFDNDTSFIPVDTTRAYDTDRLVSDFGFCTPIPNTAHFLCYAIDHDVTVPITTIPKPAGPTPSGLSSRTCPPPKSGLPVLECGTPPAAEMIATLVDVNGFDVRAMIDTGNSFGLSIPQKLADKLFRLNRADRGVPSRTTLADGSTENVETITIHYITVDQRVLYDVVASVSPNDEAPVLLGLPVLTRLGPWHFSSDGRIVFTGAPA